MAGSANNVAISPVNMKWQMESEAQVDYSGIAAVDLDAAYWTLNSAKDAIGYYLWHDLDAGSSDPAPAGLTGIEVEVVTGDSATAIATKVAAALDALGDFVSSSDAGVVTYTAAAVGEVTDPADVDAGVSIVICRVGKDFDLGLIEGDVEKNYAPANFILNSHQFGLTPLSALNQGIETLEVGTILQETNRSNLKEMYKIWGGAFTPSAGTEVFGVGTAAIGKNMLTEAGRLVMEPVNFVNSELSYNTTLMLAVPVPDSLVFSGENPRTLSVTWQGFADTSKDGRVNAVLIGDETQDVDA